MFVNYEQSVKINNVPNVVHGFFMRHGGVSLNQFSSLNCSFKVKDEKRNVKENRLRVLQSLGIQNYKLFVPNIVHGSESIIIDEDLYKKDIEQIDADALITSLPFIALGITYADCVPILLASADGACIAAIHAGWRGIAQEIIIKTVQRLSEYKQNNQLIAAIGPAISQSGFLVNGDVLKFFKDKWPQFVNKDRVDLSKIAYAQLKITGVEVVEKVGGHTDLDAKKYFSHRRGESGRQIAIIAIRSCLKNAKF